MLLAYLDVRGMLNTYKPRENILKLLKTSENFCRELDVVSVATSFNPVISIFFILLLSR